ncbi:hypothetical protein SAMD00079811_26510 [Scytonema sp. HK-05]|nr:hypothetical protein SAMD00079811_26510 [Scytonema sp. HK-05]
MGRITKLVVALGIHQRSSFPSSVEDYFLLHFVITLFLTVLTVLTVSSNYFPIFLTVLTVLTVPSNYFLIFLTVLTVLTVPSNYFLIFLTVLSVLDFSL